MRRFGALLAAALAGAAGTGAQCVLLAEAALSAGQSAAGAFGLGAFVAGWALGAGWAGRRAGSARRIFVALALAGPAVLGGAWFALARASSGSLAMAPALAFGVLALAGIAQGPFLPLLARASRDGRTPSVSALFAANLFGSVGGAWGLGFEAIAAWGRVPALALALALSALAAAIGAKLAGDREALASESPARVPLRIGLVAALGTAWTLGLEWLCLRLGVLWVGGQAPQLAAIVAWSLVALALGAWILPKLLPRGERGLCAWFVVAALGTAWPAFASIALERVAPRGDVLTIAVLVLPSIAPLGALVPMLHAACEGESGERLGRLLRYEILGALAVGPALHVGLVPSVGIGGALAALAGCGALACVAGVARKVARGPAALGALGCAAVAIAVALAPEPALGSPKLADPALVVREFREDRHFAVAVVDDGLIGERTLLTDQFRAAGTGRDYRYMRVLGHLPLVLHESPRNVAVLALGTGTTLGAIAMHPEVERIDVLEISRAVVDFAPWFESANRGALDGRDERVHVLVDDGRRTLATRSGEYDVVTMEPLLPDSPFGVYLYTPEFYRVAKRSLRPGGILCQWIPPHALEPVVFDALLEAFGRAFPSAQAWLFGTQLILIGSDDAPRPREIALSTELRAALAELGLDSAAGVRARRVCDLRGFLDSPRRPLRDSDPWIAWRRKPEGAQVLEWLPANLARITSASDAAPWPAAPGDARLREALQALRQARIALGATEIELRRGTSNAQQARDRALAALGGLDREQMADPEVRSFLEEVEFLFRLRDGVVKLAAGAPREALDPLVRAAELRGERADVHGYVAAALLAANQREAARVALRRAIAACPKLAATPIGARLLALGIPVLWMESEEVEHASAVFR